MSDKIKTTTTDSVCFSYEVKESVTKNETKIFIASGKFNDDCSFVMHASSLTELKEKVRNAYELNGKIAVKEHKLLNQRAIWLSNFRKTENGFSFWFSIIGIGLNIVYRKPITKTKVFFINHWREND